MLSCTSTPFYWGDLAHLRRGGMWCHSRCTMPLAGEPRQPSRIFKGEAQRRRAGRPGYFPHFFFNMRKSYQSTTELTGSAVRKKKHAFSLCPRPQACVDVTAHARFARSQVVAGTPPHLVCHNSSSVGRLWPNLPHCVAQRHQSTRFSMQRVEALSGRCFRHVEEG